MQLVRDKDYQLIQSFVPRKGRLQLSGDYTPAKDEVLMLGNVTDIVIDEITVSYPAGTILVLSTGITYTFGSDTALHLM